LICVHKGACFSLIKLTTSLVSFEVKRTKLASTIIKML